MTLRHGLKLSVDHRSSDHGGPAILQESLEDQKAVHVRHLCVLHSNLVSVWLIYVCIPG